MKHDFLKPYIEDSMIRSILYATGLGYLLTSFLIGSPLVVFMYIESRLFLLFVILFMTFVFKSYIDGDGFSF